MEFTGHIEVTAEEKKMAEIERWAWMAREHGLEPELLTSRQIGEDYPWLSARLIGGCRIPTDGSANPRLAAPFIAMAARRAGADIREHVGATEVTHDGRAFKVSTSAGEEFLAPILINAAGAWGGKLAETLGDRVPWLTLAPQMVVSEPLPYRIRGIVDCDVGGRYLYIRQTARGNVLFGRGPGRGGPRGRALRDSPKWVQCIENRAGSRRGSEALLHHPHLVGRGGQDARTFSQCLISVRACEGSSMRSGFRVMASSWALVQGQYWRSWHWTVARIVRLRVSGSHDLQRVHIRHPPGFPTCPLKPGRATCDKAALKTSREERDSWRQLQQRTN